MADNVDKLGDIRDAVITDMINKNTYQKGAGTEYTTNHPNALGDGDKKGKGTGVFMDTYNGGDIVDIDGNGVDEKTGRVSNLGMNTYNKKNGYVQSEEDPTQ